MQNDIRRLVGADNILIVRISVSKIEIQWLWEALVWVSDIFQAKVLLLRVMLRVFSILLEVPIIAVATLYFVMLDSCVVVLHVFMFIIPGRKICMLIIWSVRTLCWTLKMWQDKFLSRLVKLVRMNIYTAGHEKMYALRF